jgi:serine O-acetyltransferase
MWSEFCADVSLYSALRCPGAGRVRRALNCAHSRGLFVLTVQRLNRYYSEERRRSGWTLQTIALRVLIGIGRAVAIVAAKCDVAASSVIGAGVYLSDYGHLILGPKCVGSGTVIHSRVTMGVRAGSDIRPAIGENVWIGPDCIIYGELTVGDGATILPGTVLSMSVPPRAVAAGNPATIIRRDFDNTGLRRTLACDIDRNEVAPT